MRIYPLSRASSSPNLAPASARHASHEHHQDEQFFVVGDRVCVDGHRLASVAYFGETHFGSGDWVGLVLDEPTGNHAGRLHGHEYFQCAPNHGLFVRAHRVARLNDSALGSSATSSRCATPAPRSRYSPSGAAHSRSASRASTVSSPLDSYYYDDDYRQDSMPTIASLTRKLKSIDESNRRPVGILKHGSGSSSRPTSAARSTSFNGSHDPQDNGHHLPPPAHTFNSHIEDLRGRLPAGSVPPGTAARSVFNFRPKREQLEQETGATYSRDAHKRSVNLSGFAPPRKGDRVLVRTEREGELSGLLRFMGQTNFATGEWAGVELDEPVGKNDGSILGFRYFHCPKNYGLFVPATRVRKFNPGDEQQDGPVADASETSDSAMSRFSSTPSIFGSMRSTIKSPPPRSTSLSRSSASRSATPGYNMDTLSPASRSSSSLSAAGKLYPHSSRSASLSQPLLWQTTDLDQFAARDYQPEPPVRMSSSRYGQRASSTSPRQYQENHWSSAGVKFEDHDIDLQLRRSLNKPKLAIRPSASSSPFLSYSSPSPSPSPFSSSVTPKPKSVEYTFISNKLDGNPIARRTLIYK